MCGIIGYIGEQDATQIVINGLKTLEYRGYDSWGIAMNNNGNLNLIKEAGFLDDKIASTLSSSNIAIGHTRWATHGVPSANNAHPHISNNGTIAIVHNGIISNYRELRKLLENNNFTFQTEVDSEVIPNLIQFMFTDDFVEACKKAFSMLEGQFAIVAMQCKTNQIVAVRKDAPLVIGKGESGIFVASDIYAFLEYTKEVIFLEEMDMVILDNSVSVYNILENIEVKRKSTTIDWYQEGVNKGAYDHYFIKEICEQATVLEALKDIDLSKVAAEIMNSENIIITGCGSAAYAAMYGVYIFNIISGRKIDFYYAHELSSFANIIDSKTMLMAISQSGETADVLEAVRIAKNKGAKIISITNTDNSSLSRISDVVILQNAKAEICVLSTKSYTSQLAILNLLAYELNSQIFDSSLIIKDLIRNVYYLLSKSARKIINRIAENLRYSEHIYLIGKGIDYITAMESALKIKEVSYIHAEAFAGGELKHGSISLIEKGTPCIVFVSRNDEIINNAMELKARGAFIIGVSAINNPLFDAWIKVRDTGDTNAICQVIPMQILAYQLALFRGCNPDRPRNLAKSVTVK